MDQQPNAMASALISSLGWILLVGATAGFFTVGQNHYYRAGYQQGAQDQHQADFTAVERNLGIPAVDQRTELAGRITSIEGDTWVVETYDQPIHPLQQAYPTTRTVTLTGSTNFVLRVPKTPEELQAEAEGLTADVVAPLASHKEQSASRSDFSVGDDITIRPASNDFFYRESVTAAFVGKLVNQQ